MICYITKAILWFVFVFLVFVFNLLPSIVEWEVKLLISKVTFDKVTSDCTTKIAFYVFCFFVLFFSLKSTRKSLM